MPKNEWSLWAFCVVTLLLCHILNIQHSHTWAHKHTESTISSWFAVLKTQYCERIKSFYFGGIFQVFVHKITPVRKMKNKRQCQMESFLNWMWFYTWKNKRNIPRCTFWAESDVARRPDWLPQPCHGIKI